MCYRRPESVLVVVYTSDQQCLMIERAEPAGYWQSVTGGLEDDESALDCAHRELLEETGIDAVPEATGIVNRFAILEQWRHRYHPEIYENTEYVYGVCLDKKVIPTLNPREHTQYAWLDAQAAMHRCFSHTNADAIKRIVLQKI